MKKVLLLALALVTVCSLVACGKKNEPENQVVDNNQVETTQTQTQPTEEETQVQPVEEEQVGVGNTDEGMILLALEQQYNTTYPDVVEEVAITNVRIYSEEEIANYEMFNDYTIEEGDIVFEADYDLRIVENYEDMNAFTAGAGEVDGQWIRNKHNVGIVKTSGDTLRIDAFGTGF